MQHYHAELYAAPFLAGWSWIPRPRVTFPVGLWGERRRQFEAGDTSDRTERVRGEQHTR
jgi:hypothetical protein